MEGSLRQLRLKELEGNCESLVLLKVVPFPASGFLSTDDAHCMAAVMLSLYSFREGCTLIEALCVLPRQEQMSHLEQEHRATTAERDVLLASLEAARCETDKYRGTGALRPVAAASLPLEDA